MYRNLYQTMENYVDEDAERCLKWFKSFMSPGEWQTRRAKIEHYVDHAVMVAYGIDQAVTTTMAVSFNEDKIGWYMYLVDTYMHDASCYEPVAGARVFPIFLRLGQCLNELTSIEGVKKKVRRLIKKDPADADSVLFELLVALVWVRNGYQVSFMPELNTKSSPI